MASLLTIVDESTAASAEYIFQHIEKDDIAFLAFLMLSGFFYNFYIRDKPDPYYHVWFEKPQQTDANQKGLDTRDIALKLEQSKKDFAIFWGSQSGTAEEFANRLVRDCRSRFGLDALAADLSDYDPESIANLPESKLAIFIISTYGEGDPSDNSTHFLSWLRTEKSTRLPKLRYVAFGLGNKKYKFYNRVIDVVTQALDEYGATSLMPTGKADDSNGSTDEDFTDWKHALFKMFREELGMEERPEEYVPTLRVVEDTSLDTIDLNIGEPVKVRDGKKSSTAVSPIRALPIRAAKKLLATPNRNCLHLELDTTAFPELKYKTGDHLAVWPSNPTSEVQRLVNMLGLQERTQTPLLIQALDPSIKIHVPSPTTWDALLRNYLEICGPVSREVVVKLARFAPTESSRAALEELGKGKDIYHGYCSKRHVTLGKLLEDVSPSTGSWSSLPLAFLLESLPTLAPRYYSISSSSVVSPKQISITIAVSSEAPSAQTVAIPGVTTDYLQAVEQNKRGEPAHEQDHDLSGPNNVLQQGEKLFAHVRKSKFRLPTMPKTPIIMIASGSGIAPFRGFLVERARISDIGREVGKSLLFFGCRSMQDYLYYDELQGLQHSNKDTEVVTAFSRASERKVYVQDRIRDRSGEVIRLLLNHNAYLYICGSASMARDVTAALGACLIKKIGWGESELREWSETMRKGHRWQEDVWG